MIDIPMESIYGSIPPAVAIIPPQQEGEVSHYTELFRPEVFLAESLSLARTAIGGRDFISVASLACSVAEPDTLMALSDMAGFPPLDIVALDKEPDIIRWAKLGVYASTAYFAEGREAARAKNRLQDVGFEVEIDRYRYDEWFERLIIDANALRERHDVSYFVGDITKPVETDPVDLVVIANALYHMNIEDADAAFDTAIELVAEGGGVLTVGDAQIAGVPADRAIAARRFYPEWLQSKQPMLADKGFVPVIDSKTDGAPVVYVRL